MSGSPDSPLTGRSGWPVLTRWWVVAAGLLVLLVPLLYLSLLGVTAWGLVWGTLQAFERWALEPGWGLKNIGTCVGLAIGGGIWVGFFRPFWVKPEKPTTRLVVKAAAQPEWMEVVAMAVVQARGPLPVEVCLDTGLELRLEPEKGVMSGLAGRHRLTVGAAWIGVCSEGQLIAQMVACLAQSPLGLSGRCYWLMERMTRWLTRAASGEHQQGVEIEDRRSFKGYTKRKVRWWETPGIARLVRGYVWLTRLPIRLMLVLTTAVTSIARNRVQKACDLAAVRLVGGAVFAEVLVKGERLRAAEDVVKESLEVGLKNERLPDNVVLQKVKEMQLVKETQVKLAPATERRRIRALKNGGIGLIKEGAAASLLVRRYQEICRQLTQSHYEQDLGVSLNQVRLVAVGETAKRAGDEASLADIKRYFQGLAHPLRPLCGLVEETAESPTEEEMRKQVELSKRMMRDRGDQARSAMMEWTQSWQRRRDLEMAHAFALAGMPIDAKQYGLRSHDAAVYREEIERQRMSMEYADDSLRAIEADMERRLAAALGLMMGRPVASCPLHLQSMAEALPLWGWVYGALCGRLPWLWEIQNLGYALEALGLDGQLEVFKHAEAGSELEAQEKALHFLVPRIRECLEQLVQGLEQVPVPAKPECSLVHDWMEGLVLPGWGTLAEAVASGHAAVEMAARFEATYQETFAWLCRAAEAAESTWAVASPGTEACERASLGYRAGCELSFMPESMALAAR